MGVEVHVASDGVVYKSDASGYTDKRDVKNGEQWWKAEKEVIGRNNMGRNDNKKWKQFRGMGVG